MKVQELRQLISVCDREHLESRLKRKSQRPKWRFMVKNFIKELEKILPE